MLFRSDAIKDASKKLFDTKKTHKKSVLHGVKKKKPSLKSYHKDTKSHNVRISVVSGLQNTKFYL